jgi:hypothetical protein
MGARRLMGQRRRRRRGKAHGFTAVRWRHAGAMTMAVAAIEIECGRGFVNGGTGGIRTGVAVMRVLMVAQVLRAYLRLMLAIVGHRRPAELERQKREQDDDEDSTHGRQSSGLWCEHG